VIQTERFKTSTLKPLEITDKKAEKPLKRDKKGILLNNKRRKRFY